MEYEGKTNTTYHNGDRTKTEGELRTYKHGM